MKPQATPRKLDVIAEALSLVDEGHALSEIPSRAPGYRLRANAIMAALRKNGWTIVPSDWAKEASANDNA